MPNHVVSIELGKIKRSGPARGKLGRGHYMAGHDNLSDSPPESTLAAAAGSSRGHAATTDGRLGPFRNPRNAVDQHDLKTHLYGPRWPRDLSRP
jgi:hypothetical protein